MRAVIALLATLCLTACSSPPQKEIDLAQGAIDAARAAGAPQYAPAQFEAATSALQQAHDAVSQRDYRLALTQALSAHDRAQEAAREAADGKARARSSAEVAIVDAAATLEKLGTQIKEAEAAKVPRRDLDAARQTAKTALATLQDARKSAAAGDYMKAQDQVKGLAAQITAQITALEEAAARKPVRGSRRPR